MNSYITNIFLQNLPARLPRTPRDRYKNYVYDLYKLYGDQVTESTFMEGSQYTFAEIGNAVFEVVCAADDLQSYDLMVISHWSEEFDPEYASCGPHFLFKHGFDCNNFDVCGSGTTAPFLALDVIKQYQENQASKKALLLVMEQTSVPRNKASYDLVPMRDGGVALVVEAAASDIKNSLKIKNIQLIHEAAVLNNGFNALLAINNILTRFDISGEDASICLSKSSLVYKSLEHFRRSTNKTVDFKITYFDYRHGCLPVFECIKKIFDSSVATTRYIMIFQEDVESLEIAYVLLERV